MMEIVPRLEKRTHYIALANVIHAGGSARHHHRPDQGLTAVAQVNPAEKAELLSASNLDRDEQHGVRSDGRDPVPAHPRVLQARTSEIVDSLEVAKISFLNLVERVKAEPAPTK